MRRSLPLLTVAAGLILPAGAASAATVSVPTAGGPAVYQADPGPSDLVSHYDFTLGFEFADALQPIVVGSGCVGGPPVSCVARTAEVHFGDKADRFRGGGRGPLTITGGGGADTIRAAGEWNTVSGGDGSDSVWENGNSTGSVSGDAGNDKLYSFEAAARLHGGLGDDLLVAGSFSFGNQLSGDDGNDQIVVDGSASGTVNGGNGADTVVIDVMRGGYTIDSGAGADTVKAGPYTDAVTAGAGNDVIDVSGDPGNADSVSCGSGKDTVYADADDVIAADCERIFYRTPSLASVASARAAAAAFVAAMPDIPAF